METPRNISQIKPNEQPTKENGQKIMELDSTGHKEKANEESLLEMLKTLKKIGKKWRWKEPQRMAGNCKSTGQTFVYP